MISPHGKYTIKKIPAHELLYHGLTGKLPRVFLSSHQTKRWKCDDCGSRHSQRHDAVNHWLEVHWKRTQ